MTGAVKNWQLRGKYREVIPSTSYLTHGIHSYTAKLIPHIPRYFIENYTCEGDTILDPFCGSGTALLEARLLHRNAIGIDINPLAVLISEVKTTPLDINELSLAIQLVKKEVKNGNGKIIVQFPNIGYWFCRKAQDGLSKIRFGVENLNGGFNPAITKFLSVCFSSIIRRSSYADPRMAKTYRSKRVIEKIHNGWTPTPIQYFEEVLDKDLEEIKLLSERLNPNINYVKVFQGDARAISPILKQAGIKRVDFIITSPPYINAQDYFRSYKLEIWWLGLSTPQEIRKLNKQVIGTENVSGCNCDSPPKSEHPLPNLVLNKIWRINKRKSCIVSKYFENMREVLEESYDVLKTGGHLCLITGNNTICGVSIPTYKIITHIAENVGFKLVEIGRDKIRNRLLPPDRNHHGGIIKEEWITVFRKEEIKNEN